MERVRARRDLAAADARLPRPAGPGRQGGTAGREHRIRGRAAATPRGGTNEGRAGRGALGRAALITAILLMLVHAFIVTNARAEAEVAASQGLRAAWRAAADSDFLTDPGDPRARYTDPAPHPDVLAMVAAAEDAVARAAATEQGWRWWTPGAAQVSSDWCHRYTAPVTPRDPSLVRGGYRPFAGETGWVRVVVSGEVFGPLAALWPNRWDRIQAAAQGPALLVPSAPGEARFAAVPGELPAC